MKASWIETVYRIAYDIPVTIPTAGIIRIGAVHGRVNDIEPPVGGSIVSILGIIQPDDVTRSKQNLFVNPIHDDFPPASLGDVLAVLGDGNLVRHPDGTR